MPDEESYLPPPPEFDHAPTWAHALWTQQRHDVHRLTNGLTVVQGEVHQIKKILGSAPDSDGRGGRGLVGDVQSLKVLRTLGIGFIAAISLTAALLIMGIIYWIKSIVKSN